MRRVVRLGERSLTVALQRDGDRLRALVDGREYRLSVREAQPGVYSFVEGDGGGASHEVVVQEGEGLYRVRIRDRSFEAAVERPGAAAQAREGRGGGAGVIKTVMPGRVVRLLVAPGASVRRGQGVVVIEAMKMENEIGSPREGKVKEIRVAPGERVEGGATLAVIE